MITAIYQPVFHFWQPLIKLNNNFIELNDNIALGLCFISLSLTRYIVNRLVRKKTTNKTSFFNLLFISIIVSVIMFLLIGITSSNYIICIIFFSLLHASLSLNSRIISDQYLKISLQGQRSSIFSVAAIFGRVFGLIYLSIIYIIVQYIGVNGIFLTTSILGICLYLFSQIWKNTFLNKND